MVSFDEFMSTLRDAVDRFEKNYRDQATWNPDEWPLVYNSNSDWFEQFIMMEDEDA